MGVILRILKKGVISFVFRDMFREVKYVQGICQEVIVVFLIGDEGVYIQEVLVGDILDVDFVDFFD